MASARSLSRRSSGTSSTTLSSSSGSLAPASDGALIVPTMTPVITAVLATFVGERLTGRRVAGFALGSLGAALVILAGAASEAFSTRSEERRVGKEGRGWWSGEQSKKER